MSARDPFDEVRTDITQAMDGCDGQPGIKGMYERWKELAAEPAPSPALLGEMNWLQDELLGGLRQVEWDVKDMQETIGIVQGQPSRFQIGAGEIERRLAFVDMIAQQVDNIRRALDRGPAHRLHAPSPSKGKRAKGGYEALEADAAQTFEEDMRREFAEQDERLQAQVAPGISTLKDMAEGMRSELREQEGMLGTLESGIDRAKATLSHAMRRLDVVSDGMSNTRKLCCIVVLVIVLVLLIVLTFSM
eukprot:TRINITY_DN51624_c0_g1_i1.p1 TRINITY_DN51624_c0_g1~~TRINITY_DN51624_c0_g1_i1.p1  ORF type:complete len:247 (+),score=106.81 TRINITY_DN51624_c0_g1_i1:180-920(+)